MHFYNHKDATITLVLNEKYSKKKIGFVKNYLNFEHYYN